VALWIAAGANPKEVSARAGHSSVSFTLDRYGHLYPEADTALRFIEIFYNRQRRHSTLDYANPASYEQQHPSPAPAA
jgi:transposase InsO family protein